MIDYEALKKQLMSITSIEEMESFLNDNYNDLFIYYLDNNLIVTEDIIKMFSLVSPEFAVDLLATLYDYLEDIKLVTILYDYNPALTINTISAINEGNPSFLRNIYQSGKKNPKILSIIKSLSIKQKGLLFNELSTIYESMLDDLLTNRDELMLILSSNVIDTEAKSNIFKHIDFHYKKKILMDERISPEDKISFITFTFKDKYGRRQNQQLHDYVLNSFINSYRNGNQLSLLILLDLIDKDVELKYSEGSAYYQHGIYYENGIRNRKEVNIDPAYVPAESTSGIFHEIGHFLFDCISGNKTPDGYQNLSWGVRSEILNYKMDELNDFLALIQIAKGFLLNKIRAKESSSVMKSFFEQFIKGNLKDKLIEYMKQNGYSESLIQMINERFSSFTIDMLEELEQIDDIERLFAITSDKYIGEYQMFEDLINSIFGGETDYVRPENSKNGTCGHPVMYYFTSDRYGLQYNEGIANFFAIVMSGNQELLDKLLEIIGHDAFLLFQNTLLEFALYGVPEEDIELREKIKNSLYHDSGRKLSSITEETKQLKEEDLIVLLKKLDSSFYALPKEVLGVDEDEEEKDKKEEQELLSSFNENDLEKIKMVFTELSFVQKRKILESPAFTMEYKSELVSYDLSKTFMEEAKYSEYLQKLLNRLKKYSSDNIESLLLIEAFIEVKRTKGFDEEYRKAV